MNIFLLIGSNLQHAQISFGIAFFFFQRKSYSYMYTYTSIDTRAKVSLVPISAILSLLSLCWHFGSYTGVGVFVLSRGSGRAKH